MYLAKLGRFSFMGSISLLSGKYGLGLQAKILDNSPTLCSAFDRSSFILSITSPGCPMPHRFTIGFSMHVVAIKKYKNRLMNECTVNFA